ncbi:Spore coat polysaccharide biosynthesis protein SpsG, predicted glycosyltransferase [Pilibacter termitis]|uniref:Spore coat polysaccharide biosynthesis protein SpsG, predicted glycosyltransferase n=1 Tax=Pilibacter termitis TaxID=263852 RepID=A0A1T4P407_9ENTE|nr:hypothetical protein [Pilibacter termitis]SJZ86162.1 Spore coat polysaccharide biosynthesis protein SpsG, predicted glycosyltransferase [Pilibacter termitis]
MSQGKKTIYIFTEASDQIGYGHLTRCFALYDAAKFLGANCKIMLEGHVHNEMFFENREIEYCHWQEETCLSEIYLKNCYCIIDSYLADKEIYDFVSQNAKRCVFIDDFKRLNYPNGILLNPLLLGETGYQLSGDDSIVLKGEQYVITRAEFRSEERNRFLTTIQRVLILFGGTDALGVRESVVQHLSTKYPEIIFHVVIGNQQSIQEIEKENIRYYYELQARELSTLMDSVDFAITAMGQTIFELLSLGVPFLPIQVADNQENNKLSLKQYFPELLVYDARNKLDLERIAQLFGLVREEGYRKKFTKQLLNLIDGCGANRVISILLDEKNRREYE